MDELRWYTMLLKKNSKKKIQERQSLSCLNMYFKRVKLQKLLEGK